MKLKHNKIDFRGQEIYVGIDVHLKSWSVTILTEDFEHKTYTMSPVSELLVRYLCVYEAGFSGFWLQRQLNNSGIDCLFVRNQTRCKNRIKSLLYYNGIKMEVSGIKTYWSQKYINQLESIIELNELTKQSLLLFVNELKHIKATIKQIDANIKLLSQGTNLEIKLSYYVQYPV